jgi:nitrogen regulatory protein PII
LEDENIENDQVMMRSMDKPHTTVLKILGFGDKELSQIMHFPATKCELLDKLKVRLVVFEDRIEVKAVFPVGAIGYQSAFLSDERTGNFYSRDGYLL